MDRATIGLLMMVGLFVSLATGFPIAGTFLLLSVVGLTLILNFDQATGMLAQGLYYTVASPNWAALPLFILMGTFAAFGGYAQVAFNGLNKSLFTGKLDLFVHKLFYSREILEITIN